MQLWLHLRKLKRKNRNDQAASVQLNTHPEQAEGQLKEYKNTPHLGS